MILLAWVLPLLLGAAAIAYLASKDDNPRCPYCKAFVKKNSPACNACGAKLGWS